MSSPSGSLALSLALSAVAYGAALTLAAWLFDGFRAELVWLIVAVVVFMVLTVALRRVIVNTVDRFVRGFTILGGLVLTFVALTLTDWLVPRAGFDIDGGWTWVGVTWIVWTAGVAWGEADSKAPAGTPGQSPAARA
jgi:hypothetical protein